MNALLQHSFFLNSGGQQLAATALLPNAARGTVLFLLPFAEERKGTLPFYLEMARDLYRNNIASLIFDWQGSGDSTGDFESTDPNEFLTNIDSALQWIHETLPKTPITALGTRISAAFLTQIAAERQQIQQMVLIAPASGAEFIHQLLQRRMVNDMVAYGKAIESRVSLIEQLQRGQSVDLDGYTFTSQFYDWAVKSSESDERPTSLKNILLISGGHSPKIAKEITEQWNNVSKAEIRFPPFWNTVGHVDLNQLQSEICDWIKTGFTADPQSLQIPELCCESAEAELIEITVKDSKIRAIIDRPATEPTAGVLFLPGWSGDRTGPHRIFTQLARELAQSGVLCLRFDYRGRGLSDGSHAEASISSMAEDAEAALNTLQQLLPQSTPVYVAAICSGCKVAITLASTHTEIKKLLLLSAESMGALRSSKTDANKTQTALKTYLKKLTQIETWKKILTGKVQTKMVTKALVKHETRSSQEAQSEDQTLARFEKFANPVHFVFGGSDPDALGSMAAYKRYCEKNRIPHTVHLIPHAGHSYYSAEWTRDLSESSHKFLMVRDKV